jgi:transcriptional regulator with XRE-family HTH domain
MLTKSRKSGERSNARVGKLVGRNIRALRLELRLTQVDFARAIGEPRSVTVSEWENGRRTPQVADLIKIARVFPEASLDDLCGLVPQQKVSAIDFDRMVAAVERFRQSLLPALAATSSKPKGRSPASEDPVRRALKRLDEHMRQFVELVATRRKTGTSHVPPSRSVRGLTVKVEPAQSLIDLDAWVLILTDIAERILAEEKPLGRSRESADSPRIIDADGAPAIELGDMRAKKAFARKRSAAKKRSRQKILEKGAALSHAGTPQHRSGAARISANAVGRLPPPPQ